MISALAGKHSHDHASPTGAIRPSSRTSRQSAGAPEDATNTSDAAADLLPPLGEEAHEAENSDLIERLESRHADVLAHEAAHLAAAGAYAKGGATYTFQIGPDGKAYAIGGSVRVDMSPIPGNPRATIAKMAAIRASALAPSDPSPEDLSVASRAAQIEALARADLQASQEMAMDPAMRKAAGQYTEASGKPGMTLAAKA